MKNSKTMTKAAFLAALLPLIAGCPPAAPPPIPAPVPATVTSFSASATQAAPGDKVTLTWAVQDATSVSLTELTAGPVAIDPAAQSGSVEVKVEADAVFNLTARGEGGTDSRLVAVVVSDAQDRLLLIASPTSIPAGSSTNLAWSAPGATAVSIKELGGAAVDLGGQKEAGSVRVQPAFSTTYELEADGRKASAAVQVQPAIFSFTAGGTSASAGQPLTLSWTTGGGRRVALARVGAGTLHHTSTEASVASGSYIDTIPAELPADGFVTYELTLTAEGLTASKALTVYVGAEPRILSFTAPAYAVPDSALTVSWQTAGADRLELWVDGKVAYQALSQATVDSGSHALTFATAALSLELRASNARGGLAKVQKTVEPVTSTTLTSFTATPATIADGGEGVTLTWATPGARRLRIVANDEYTVLTRSGMAAESGTVTVYPNEATSYVLTADNTLGSSVTGTQSVTVTTPAAVTPGRTGAVPPGATSSLSFSVGGAGAMVQGLAHSTIDSTQASSGFIDISTTGAKLGFTPTADDETASFTPNP
ncbi:MAG: hypothetical protein ACYC8T_21860, partial [Myxococcaceae bacterium]